MNFFRSSHQLSALGKRSWLSLENMRAARPNRFKLFTVLTVWALALALARAGNSSPAPIAVMPMVGANTAAGAESLFPTEANCQPVDVWAPIAKLWEDFASPSRR